ncbi:MAG: YfcE family phosphodiesterase [Ilumatobacteraceae bacterium]
MTDLPGPDVLDGAVVPLLRTALSDRTSGRIGLISDTHIPEARPELWPQVFDVFAGVDAILHGGDIHELRVLDDLAAVAPLWSARGNGEDGSAGRPIAGHDPRLRYSWLLDLGGLRVGLTHDVPMPEHPPNYTVERWKHRRFGTRDIDVLVYGDSHVERIDIVDGTLCVNPGSPTYPHNLMPQLGTLGFLEIDGRTVTASLWQLTDDGADGPVTVLTTTVPIGGSVPAPADPAARRPEESR